MEDGRKLKHDCSCSSEEDIDLVCVRIGEEFNSPLTDFYNKLGIMKPQQKHFNLKHMCFDHDGVR